MNQKLERIIALYGSPREGKSSTLRELIKLMTGSLPSGVKHDYRVIIKDYYVQKEDKHVNVFIATCGDTKDVILKSILFFNGKLYSKPAAPIWLFDYGSKTWKKVKTKKDLMGIEANICVSACRTKGGGVTAMQDYIKSHLPYTFFSVWIRLALLRKKLGTPKDMSKIANWNKIATELKIIIDQIIA